MQLLKRTIIEALFVVTCCITAFGAFGQQKIIKGYIKDGLSDERIPFASIRFINTKNGKLSDSAGTFLFRLNEWLADTLEVTYVGYKDYKIFIGDELLKRTNLTDTLFLVVGMDRGKVTSEVVVKRKIDRGYLMWKRIVKHKPTNDRYRFDNFSYELYNKMELDINRVNKDKLKQIGLIKPFNFLLANIDTTEGAPYLPVYLTESISDYYCQKTPFKTREIIKGSKTEGVDNESVNKLLGGTDANVNIYSNFIPVFDKQFVSPISDNGDAYYNYRVADTQYVNKQRLIHLVFSPKRKGENTFSGDCWVHDPTWAIQKMNLFLGSEANINFIEKLQLIQEFKLINDTTWFLAKDKFVFDVAPIGKASIGFIGRKTTTYVDVKYNSKSIEDSIAKNNIKQEVIVLEGARVKNDEYWKEERHESLSKNETAVYNMIDTLQKMPIFKKYTNTISFLTTGYKFVGNYEIGPWYNWIYANSLQGFRPRFDLGTNKYFNKKLYLHGYLAYGFGNKELNGQMEALYVFKKNPRSYVHVSYLNDYDFGQTYYDEVSQDNIFALAVRKPNVPLKFLKIEEIKLEGFKEWKTGFSVLATVKHKTYNPVLNLPPAELFVNTAKGETITTTEASVRFRFAYLEKFLDGNYYRISLGSPYPITEFKYTKGIPDVFNSRYSYNKIEGSVSDYLKIAPYGSIYYNVFGGRTFGTLPYTMLNIMPGNEMYYYNKYAFSLMNRFEYIGDRYAGINFEHNFGNGLFRFIPLTRKLKFRQFWNAKVITTNISKENYDLNFNNNQNSFQNLGGKTYVELGTGVDNIFKFLRVDFVWRVAPTPLPPEKIKRFGIFFSFRLAF